MKPRLHIGWVVFAVSMGLIVCAEDLPRLLAPQRTEVLEFVAALLNLIAVLGLLFYAFHRRGTSTFWRVFTPLYALFFAGQIAKSLTVIGRLAAAKGALGENGDFVMIGAIIAVLPMLAIMGFIFLALARLGDWIGPTRRPLRLRSEQLTLSI